MPTYDFICNECEQEYEENRPVGDYDSKCPVCNSTNVKKLISAPNVILSGSTPDSIIGRDAEQRWAQYTERKKQRDKNNFGNASSKEVEIKNQQRIGRLVDRQHKAYDVLDKAKKKAGVTKREEISYLLKGQNNV